MEEFSNTLTPFLGAVYAARVLRQGNEEQAMAALLKAMETPGVREYLQRRLDAFNAVRHLEKRDAAGAAQRDIIRDALATFASPSAP